MPLIIALLSYLIIWACGFGELYNVDFLSKQKESYNLVHWNDLAIFLFHFGLIATISFIVSLPSILGEEIGWRGFLVPELAKTMSFTGVGLVSGFIWALFHWPLIILGLYGNDVTPLYYQLFVFSVFITATGVIMAYFRMKTNSCKLRPQRTTSANEKDHKYQRSWTTRVSKGTTTSNEKQIYNDGANSLMNIPPDTYR